MRVRLGDFIDGSEPAAAQAAGLMAALAAALALRDKQGRP